MALNITTIKTAFKTLFDGANSAGASYDLSAGLSERVRTVSTKSPNNYMFGADMIPAVAIWTESKKVEMQGISKDQLLAKRKAAMSFNVAGIVWNSDFSVVTGDSSDDEIEKLMENIEEVLRSDPTLSKNVLWQHPSDVTYHNLSMSEQMHYKIGIMTVECVQYY